MNKFPENIQFKYPWRTYQKRVLDELNKHLDDDHLHIVAPPGSGKTVLGLEVMLRLNKPTLILAPTLTIRNQWVERFCELFLQTEKVPDWISTDIKNPKFLTVSTYQGLHSAFKDSEKIKKTIDKPNNTSNLKKQNGLITLLQNQNVGTIVVDEAHHLKNAWWQSLYEIKKGLKPTIVGLTATPPYDVSYAEWYRYITLNGPVDAEILVPELVKAGDLCPHQDYVYFSFPTQEEIQKIQKFRKRVDHFIKSLTKDEQLIAAFKNMHFFNHPKIHSEWIYNNIDFYSATVIFLNAAGIKIKKDHFKIIGIKKFVVPKFNYEWAKILLQNYLFKYVDLFEEFEAHRQSLINRLKQIGVLEKTEINFTYTQGLSKFLNASNSKLNSIEKIVEYEYDNLGDNLRMLILTDYIRKEFLTNLSSNNLDLNKIGVIPIFEKLRRKSLNDLKLGVLTGSLVIIPASAIETFKALMHNHNLSKVSFSALSYDQDYVVVKVDSQLKQAIVSIVTQMFENGEIEVLTGTKSLLGEGWDAPAINTLILASFVGSFVLSNQMRGRAIRTYPKIPDKTANIWHLVSIDPTEMNMGNDYSMLKRRFKTFVGISFKKEITIENGLGRLLLPDKILSQKDIDTVNKTMLTNASKRDELIDKWQKAIEQGQYLIEEIKVPFSRSGDYWQVKTLYYNRTIKYLLGMLSAAFFAFLLEMTQILGKVSLHIDKLIVLKNWLLAIAVFGILIFGKFAFHTFRVFLKYRDITKDFQQIGDALLHTLVQINIIQTDISQLKVVAYMDDMGALYAWLDGGNSYERSIFIKSLQELLAPIQNPRYIIVRKSFTLKIISQKDYHAVPEIIGKNKQFALDFEKNWRKTVGACQLIFTRTFEGRKLLLKSRINSLASEFEDRVERINKWK